MPAYNKFNSFVEAMAKKSHNLGTDVIKIALTNTAPVAGNTVLANITEIAYTNCSARTVTITSCTQTAGTLKWVLQDLLISASGGSVGPFRYVVLYNDTATNKELIGWYDNGLSITLANGESVNIDFDGTNGVFTAV